MVKDVISFTGIIYTTVVYFDFTNVVMDEPLGQNNVGQRRKFGLFVKF